MAESKKIYTSQQYYANFEGDAGNSRYWYNRSGLEVFESFQDPNDELKSIRKKLLNIDKDH